MKKRLVALSFSVLLLFFAALVAVFAFPSLAFPFLNPFFLFGACSALALLGMILICLTLKSELKGNLKNFLLITGFSALGIFLSVLLHNFIYALLFMGLLRIPRVDESFFFLLATIVFPISFLVGAGGAIALFFKNR